MRTDRPPAREVRPSRPKVDRQVAFRLGVSAELRAAAVLLAKGYRILARRWRGPMGEIDLVARRGRTLVFVEVKARATIDDAAWSVTPRQRQRIVTAAQAWLAAHPQRSSSNIRFDVVLVVPRRWPRHIVAAFTGEG